MTSTMANSQQTTADKDELRAIVARVLELGTEEVTDDAGFRDDLGVDSLALLEIATQIESAFGVSLTDDDISAADTLDEIQQLLDKARRSDS
ncbi:acyl carrier protein [Streptomyces sp. RPT161]|uniref:acyl carrier protein n=1 Tax=Streptomyces sp. RPT161 TaxID=3015993 RepID=UPI0022B8DFFD|nr:acyl carrier protein [Streptomyces sp. RPT161]